MPWICNICGNELVGAAPPGGASPRCFNLPACKKKTMNGCTWQAPIVVVELGNSADDAEALGYPNRVNTRGKSFPNKHSTDMVYENNSHNRAISPDGSTHSGGRVGWKAFTIGSSGYSYSGSFQANLAPWPHRPNADYDGAFPDG